MSKWTMIDVIYSRIPEEVKYQVKISVNEVEMVQKGEERQLIEKDLHRVSMTAVPMGELVEEIHGFLREYPDAKVTMIQEPTRPRAYRRNHQGYELDQEMVNLIRDDLEAAKKMFAPIERTVRVRPVPVRLEPQQGE